MNCIAVLSLFSLPLSTKPLSLPVFIFSSLCPCSSSSSRLRQSGCPWDGRPVVSTGWLRCRIARINLRLPYCCYLLLTARPRASSGVEAERWTESVNNRAHVVLYKITKQDTNWGQTRSRTCLIIRITSDKSADIKSHERNFVFYCLSFLSFVRSFQWNHFGQFMWCSLWLRHRSVPINKSVIFIYFVLHKKKKSNDRAPTWFTTVTHHVRGKRVKRMNFLVRKYRVNISVLYAAWRLYSDWVSRFSFLR